MEFCTQRKVPHVYVLARNLLKLILRQSNPSKIRVVGKTGKAFDRIRTVAGADAEFIPGGVSAYLTQEGV